MSDIPPIQSAVQTSGLSPQRAGAGKSAVTPVPEDDRLEISETGQLLSSLGADSGIRAEKVATIRQAIADGTYETPEKMEVTISRLLEALRGMSVTA